MNFLTFKFWSHPLTVRITSLLNDRFKKKKILSWSFNHLDPSQEPDTIRTAIAQSSNGPLGARCLYKSLEAACLVLKLAREIEPALKSPQDEIMSKHINSFYVALDILQEQVYSGYLMFHNKCVISIEGLPGAGI